MGCISHAINWHFSAGIHLLVGISRNACYFFVSYSSRIYPSPPDIFNGCRGNFSIYSEIFLDLISGTWITTSLQEEFLMLSTNTRSWKKCEFSWPLKSLKVGIQKKIFKSYQFLRLSIESSYLFLLKCVSNRYIDGNAFRPGVKPIGVHKVLEVSDTEFLV